MDGIETFETFFSVKADVELLASIMGSDLETAVDEQGPVRLADKNDGPVRFTLFSFDEHPEWTHVLSSDPDDIESLGAFISGLGIPASDIEVAVDETREPVRDIEVLRAHVDWHKARNRYSLH